MLNEFEKTLAIFKAALGNTGQDIEKNIDVLREQCRELKNHGSCLARAICQDDPALALKIANITAKPLEACEYDHEEFMSGLKDVVALIVELSDMKNEAGADFVERPTTADIVGSNSFGASASFASTLASAKVAMAILSLL